MTSQTYNDNVGNKCEILYNYLKIYNIFLKYKLIFSYFVTWYALFKSLNAK